MTAIYVARPFTLMRDDGTQQSFAVGEQEVEEAIAAHWYVRVHCTEKPVAASQPVMPAEPLSGSDVQTSGQRPSPQKSSKQGKR